LTIVFEEAMKQANLGFGDLTAIAVTEGPGLVGALLTGINAAKALAFSQDLPLIGVHHIAGHIYANRLLTEMEFPLLALVVSGGHTELVYMKEHAHFEVIGETLDDAAGEAYDKVARTLGLPYPGGPHIDRLAHEGVATIDLPRAWLGEGSFDFSFSGLKSAVINTLHNAKQKGIELEAKDVLVTKTAQAVDKYQVKQLLLAGGVAANKGLRAALEKEFSSREGLKLLIPPLSLCTDNAAMIAAVGSILYEKGVRSDLALNANPGLELPSF
jgi:N6-L-threonylcarbamoyladenine synthase